MLQPGLVLKPDVVLQPVVVLQLLVLPLHDEVRHDDQVDGPVADVEEDEEQREHVGRRPVETQLELGQLRLQPWEKLYKEILSGETILQPGFYVLSFRIIYLKSVVSEHSFYNINFYGYILIVAWFWTTDAITEVDWVH